MKKKTLKTFFCSLLAVGSILQAKADFPEISELERDDFIKAVRTAQWSVKEKIKKFTYGDRELFMIYKDWSGLAKEPPKHDFQLAEIQFIKTEQKENKIHYYYNRILGSCYWEGEEEILPFSMYTEIMESEKK